jgi:hypothetical protein
VRMDGKRVIACSMVATLGCCVRPQPAGAQVSPGGETIAPGVPGRYSEVGYRHEVFQEGGSSSVLKGCADWRGRGRRSGTNSLSRWPTGERRRVPAWAVQGGGVAHRRAGLDPSSQAVMRSRPIENVFLEVTWH